MLLQRFAWQAVANFHKKYISLKKSCQTYFDYVNFIITWKWYDICLILWHTILTIVLFSCLRSIFIITFRGKYPLIFKRGHLPLIQSRRQRMEGKIIKTFTIKNINEACTIGKRVHAVHLTSSEMWGYNCVTWNYHTLYNYKLIKIRLYRQRLTCVFNTLKEMLGYLFMSFLT